MAIDTDKLKDDAAGILNLLGKITPGGFLGKKIGQGLSNPEIMKVIKKLLERTPPGQAAQVVKFIVDRYKIPESVAERMVANEMTDANMPTDPSGSADEGFPSRPEFESSAEDTSVMPDKKINISELRKKLQDLDRSDYQDEGFPESRPDKKGGSDGGPLRPFSGRVPMEDRDYSMMQDVMPMFKRELTEEDYFPQGMMIPPSMTDKLSIPMPMFNQGGRVGLAEGTMMASAPDAMDERNQVMEAIAMKQFGRPLSDLSEDEIIQIEMMMDEMSKRKDQPKTMASMDDPFYRQDSRNELALEMFGKELRLLTPEELDLLDEEGERLMQKFSGGQPLPEDPTKPINPFGPKPMEDSRQMAQAGGRMGFQTGGTEYTEQRSLPPEFIEAAQQTYLTDLATQSGLPSVTTANVKQPGETDAQFAQRQAQATQFGITKAGMADLAPQVAAQDALQTQAYNLGQTGLGSFQPFLTDASTAAGAATALTGTGAGTGAGSISSYMSPYQQQVIDTTMQDFDQQAQIRANQNAAATLGTPGAFGGGREGVQRAQYQAQSDQNRAQTLGNLRQSGFQNAAARRQQDLANQMGISNLQGGLGARAQDFSRAQISGLGTLGAAQQAQNQAVLNAQQQAAQMAIQEPRQALDRFGQGIAGITPGAGGVRLTDSPAAAQSSPLMQALGIGLAGADIYGRIF